MFEFIVGADISLAQHYCGWDLLACQQLLAFIMRANVEVFTNGGSVVQPARVVGIFFVFCRVPLQRLGPRARPGGLCLKEICRRGNNKVIILFPYIMINVYYSC
jgi:hypothetical protein